MRVFQSFFYFFSMNQLLLSHFIILNYLFISIILGCVELENNDGSCGLNSDQIVLTCRLHNPLFKIKSINCSQNIRKISLQINTWADFIDLLTKNNQSTLDIFNLCTNDPIQTCLTDFTFINLTSSSDLINIVIDKNIISSIPIRGLKSKKWIYFKFNATQWRNVNIAVSENINTFQDIKLISLSARIGSDCWMNSFFQKKWSIYSKKMSKCRRILTLISSSTYLSI